MNNINKTKKFPDKIVLDTSVLLQFYEPGEASITALKEFCDLVLSQKYIFVLPDIIRDEYDRRLPSIIALYCQKINSQRVQINQAINPPKPAIVAKSDSIKQIESLKKRLSIKYNDLLETYQSKSLSQHNEVNRCIKKLFKNSKELHINNQIFTAARKRCLVANPPYQRTKRGKIAPSIGDAIIWESIKTINHNNIIFIATDQDWIDPNNDNSLHPFLLKEWGRSNRSNKISFFTKLSSFVKIANKNITNQLKEKISEEEEQTVVRHFGTRVVNSGTIPDTLQILHTADHGTLDQFSDNIDIGLHTFDHDTSTQFVDNIDIGLHTVNHDALAQFTDNIGTNVPLGDNLVTSFSLGWPCPMNCGSFVSDHYNNSSFVNFSLNSDCCSDCSVRYADSPTAQCIKCNKTYFNTSQEDKDSICPHCRD